MSPANHPTPPVYFRAQQAVDYLRDRHGFTTTVGTLSVLRNRGTGPRFIRNGRMIEYTAQALDDFIAERRTPEFRSTEEVDAHLARLKTS